MLRRLNQLREGLGNFCLWSWYRLRGKSYSEYYARRMDRIVRRNPAWGLNLNREFQLDYLKAKGFLPHHRLLDYGCGALSAGIHFIGYLDADRYVGVDISRAVLEEGLRRVASAGLEAKGPRVHHIDQGNMDAGVLFGDKEHITKRVLETIKTAEDEGVRYDFGFDVCFLRSPARPLAPSPAH